MPLSTYGLRQHGEKREEEGEEGRTSPTIDKVESGDECVLEEEVERLDVLYRNWSLISSSVAQQYEYRSRWSGFIELSTDSAILTSPT